MDFKRFEKDSPTIVNYDGKEYYFAGFLMPSENLIIRVRPVTGWIRENAIISDDGAVFIPRYEDTVKKGK